jgi:hypothetical protein
MDQKKNLTIINNFLVFLLPSEVFFVLCFYFSLFIFFQINESKTHWYTMDVINTSSHSQQLKLSSSSSSSSSSTGVAEEATTTFHKIINLNNVACDYVLHNGCDYERAINGLTTAFHMLRKLYRATTAGAGTGAVQSQQQQQQPGTRTSYYNADHLFFFRQPVQQRRESLSKKMIMKKIILKKDTKNLRGPSTRSERGTAALKVVTTAAAAMDASSTSTLYNNPIHISKDDDVFLTSTTTCSSISITTFLLTAITFNLALMNHIYGLQLLNKEGVQDDDGQQPPPKSKSTEYLYNAGRLYEYALQLEKARSCYALCSSNRAQSQSSSSLFIMSPFIVMSILNNLGNLHFTLNQKERSQKTFERLQSTVMMYILSRRSGSESRSGGGSTGDDSSSSLSSQQEQSHQSSSSSSPPPSSVYSQRKELIQFFFHNSYVGVNQQHQQNQNQYHLQGHIDFDHTAPAA